MISEFKSFHGQAFAELIDESRVPITLHRPSPDKNSVYVLNGRIGLYLKHSAARLQPWRFTFHKEHVADLSKLTAKFSDTFLILVCGREALAVLDADDISEVLPLAKPQGSWVSVGSKHNRMLRVEGSIGELSRKLRKSDPCLELRSVIER